MFCASSPQPILGLSNDSVLTFIFAYTSKIRGFTEIAMKMINWEMDIFRDWRVTTVSLHNAILFFATDDIMICAYCVYVLKD